MQLVLVHLQGETVGVAQQEGAAERLVRDRTGERVGVAVLDVLAASAGDERELYAGPVGEMKRQHCSVALRDQLSSVRGVLEDLVGPTVRPADGARLLGISQPALHKWLEKGEISSIRTRDGRREIPFGEFVQLLDEVDRARVDGSQRPVGRVLRDRRRRSDEEIDITRLLPKARGHRGAELQALAYHRVIAERLDDALVHEARRRLRRWLRDERIDPRWADEWERILALPLADIARRIAADTRKARELRQSSPFAGMLTPQERRRVSAMVPR